jgi:hypothetical protein
MNGPPADQAALVPFFWFVCFEQAKKMNNNIWEPNDSVQNLSQYSLT